MWKTDYALFHCTVKDEAIPKFNFCICVYYRISLSAIQLEPKYSGYCAVIAPYNHTTSCIYLPIFFIHHSKHFYLLSPLQSNSIELYNSLVLHV